MVVSPSVDAVLGVACNACLEGKTVKVHMGPAASESGCNVKITISNASRACASFVQLSILASLRSTLNFWHVVAHSHDHSSGRIIITLKCWKNDSASPENEVSPQYSKPLDDGDYGGDRANEGDDSGPQGPCKRLRSTANSGSHNEFGTSSYSQHMPAESFFIGELTECSPILPVDDDWISGERGEPKNHIGAIINFISNLDGQTTTCSHDSSLIHAEGLSDDSWHSNDAAEPSALPDECFKYVLWDTMNCISACNARVDQVLTDATCVLPIHLTYLVDDCCKIASKSVLESSWIDDPALEQYAQAALDSKLLAIDALNFASDQVCELLDSMPLSDQAEDLATLHQELLEAYPDYSAFQVPS